MMECNDSEESGDSFEDADSDDDMSFSDFESSSDDSSYDVEYEMEDYDPEGVESDDDEQHCCHWSTQRDDESEHDFLETKTWQTLVVLP